MSKPITTDLRRWFDQHMRLMADDELREGFGNLCDAIDAVQANLERENDALKRERYHRTNEEWYRGYCDGKRDDDSERLNELMDARDMGVNAVLKEPESFGLVALPRDADGEPIHVGDVMVYADGNTCPLPVVALVPPAVFLTDDGPRYADMCRHAPDTWERIIEDAVNVHGNGFNPCWTDERDALVARCRALAGDA